MTPRESSERSALSCVGSLPEDQAGGSGQPLGASQVSLSPSHVISDLNSGRGGIQDAVVMRLALPLPPDKLAHSQKR